MCGCLADLVSTATGHRHSHRRHRHRNSVLSVTFCTASLQLNFNFIQFLATYRNYDSVILLNAIYFNDWLLTESTPAKSSIMNGVYDTD